MVIAIIAILAALLLPALVSAKAKAQRIQCTNNNKQLTLATRLYCNDNRDLLPWPNWTDGKSASLQGWLYTEVNGGPPDLLSPPYSSSPQRAYESGALWQYLKSMALYRCPTDNTNTVLWRQRPQKLSTYIENGAICGYDAISPRTYTQGQFRQDGFMLWETVDGASPSGCSYYNDGASYPDPAVDGGFGPAPRQAGRCGVGLQRQRPVRPVEGLGQRGQRPLCEPPVVQSGHGQRALNPRQDIRGEQCFTGLFDYEEAVGRLSNSWRRPMPIC